MDVGARGKRVKVYITESGRRYHSTSDQECLEKAAGTQIVDLEYAVALGLTPCQTCGAPIPPGTSEGDLRWLRHIEDWAKSGRFETRQEQAFASQVLAKVQDLNPDDVQPQMIIKVREQPERVDFYIAKASLVLEVDGFAKDGTPPSAVDLERRNARDAALQSAGYVVLHFSNAEVQQEPTACISRVSRALDMKTLKDSGTPSEQSPSLQRTPARASVSKGLSRFTVLIAVVSGVIALGVLLVAILLSTDRSESTPTTVDTPPSPLESQIPDEPRSTWVPPLDKQNCPPDFPFKGNIRDDGKKIVHSPTGQFYEPAFPERCYVSLESAEKDGFRESRR